ncbi:hypothetical protein ACRJ4W_26100 [Streptomyces sp. GLT-R25]
MAPEAAGAAHSGLHLVQDQQEAVAVPALAQDEAQEPAQPSPVPHACGKQVGADLGDDGQFDVERVQAGRCFGRRGPVTTTVRMTFSAVATGGVAGVLAKIMGRLGARAVSKAIAKDLDDIAAALEGRSG